MTAEKMKLLEQEADRLKEKYRLLTESEQKMKQQNTAAFDTEKLKRYESSLNQMQSAMLRTKAQMNSIDIQRQQEAEKAAAAERAAAAEALAMANAQHEAEERTARKRQENEERVRREYERSYQLYISIAEAERAADERRQAERLAAEQALRAEITKLSTEGTQKLSKGITQLNTALTQAVRTVVMLEAVLLRVGSNAVKTGMAFDESMSQVAATLDIEQVVHQQESAFARLRNEAIEYGRITTYTASQVATSLNELALGGLSVEESLSALPQVLTLAKAGSMQLEDASTIVIASMRALNLSTSEVDTLLDQMAKTAQKSKVTVQETGDAILKTASAFNLAGQDTATMNAIIGTLGNRFENIADQANTLRTALNRISTYADDLGALGVEVEDSTGHIRNFIDIFSELREALEDKTDTERVSILTKIFGNRGYSYAAYLMNATTGELQALRAEIENSNGAAKQMAETMTDNLASDITIVKSAAESLSIAITDQLTPSLRGAAKDAVNSINSVTDQIKNGDLGEQLAETGKQIRQLLGNALEKIIEYAPTIIKFMNFIIENAGKLLKLMIALKGIKWAQTVVTGLTSVTTGVMSIHKALTLATTASTGFGSALTGVASAVINPLVLLAAALSAVGAAIFKVKAAAIDVTEGIYPTKELEEYQQLVEKNIQSINDARTGREAEIDDLEQQRKEYQKMAERIEELAGVENKTAAQERELNDLIAQLNTAIPDLGLSYDDLTGSLNMQNDELSKLIDNYINYQTVLAQTEYASQLAKEKIQLEVEYDDAKLRQEELKSKKQEADKKLRRALESYWGDTYTDEQWNSQTEAQKQEVALFVGENSENVKAAWEEYRAISNSLTEANTAYVKFGAAVRNTDAKLQNLNKDIKKNKDLLGEAAAAEMDYAELLKGAYTIAEGYIETGDYDALEELIGKFPELEEQLKANGYQLDELTGKTEEAAAADEKFADKMQKLQTVTSNYKSELKDLLSVLENVNKGTAYSTSQILDLIDKYPQLASAIRETADGYIIEADAVRELTKAKADDLVASAQEQLTMLKSQLTLISDEVSSGPLAAYDIDAGIIDERRKLEQQIAMYQQIADSVSSGSIYYGSSGSSSSGASGSSGDPYDDWLKAQKEAAKAEEAELENQYKTERITAEEYYNGLMDIARRYYAGIGELRNEYLDAESKVYQGLKKAQEDELSNAQKLTKQLREVKEAEDALNRAQTQKVQVYSGAAGFHAEADTSAIEKAQQTLADKNYSLAETLLKNAKFNGQSLSERLRSIGLSDIRDMLPDLSGLRLPTIGGGTSTTNNSTRNVTYNGGDINITVQGNVDPQTMPTLQSSIEEAVRAGIDAFLDEENAQRQTGGI